jgi:hypothetical protein
MVGSVEVRLRFEYDTDLPGISQIAECVRIKLINPILGSRLFRSLLPTLQFYY